MTLPSLRLPIALVLGSTLTAWRAYEIAPEYSSVQVEMVMWVAIGTLLLAFALFWELIR